MYHFEAQILLIIGKEKESIDFYCLISYKFFCHVHNDYGVYIKVEIFRILKSDYKRVPILKTKMNSSISHP